MHRRRALGFIASAILSLWIGRLPEAEAIRAIERPEGMSTLIAELEAGIDRVNEMTGMPPNCILVSPAMAKRMEEYFGMMMADEAVPVHVKRLLGTPVEVSNCIFEGDEYALRLKPGVSWHPTLANPRFWEEQAVRELRA